MMRNVKIIALLLAGLTALRAAERMELFWPTPNTAWSLTSSGGEISV